MRVPVLRLFLLCSAALISLPSIAAAQQTPPAPAVETVIVTATRRSENIQKVPQQVTALTAATIKQVNASSFSDFAALVPGVSFAYENPSSNLIVIRGITTGSQLSSAIGLYLDEVPLGASTSFGLGYQNFSVNLFDLDRVEVLNGPQGTLYGATSLGGTVKYVTAAPDPQHLSGTFSSQWESVEHGGTGSTLDADLNVPLPADLGAIRIDGIDEFDPGFIQDPVYHRQNQGAARTLSGRVSLLLKPTDTVDIRLTAFNQAIPSYGLDAAFRNIATRQPLIGTYSQAFPLAQPSLSSVTLYSGTLTWRLPFATFTSTTAYQMNDGRSVTDQSLVYDAALALFGAGTDAFGLHVDDHTKKFTEEARLASTPVIPWFSWLAGVYFDHEETSEIVDLFDQSQPQGNFLGLPPFISSLPSTYREIAGYADATVKFTPAIDLTFGIRESQQHQTYNESIYGLLGSGSDTVLHPAQANSNQSVTTYLINPRWQVTPDTMLYARVASGFRPGGPNFVLAPGLGNPTFQPDSLWNYEIGEKSSLFDHRLTLDADVYDIEWSNIQVTVNNGGVNQLENAGNARVQGLEAAAALRVTNRFTLSGSMSVLDAHLTTAAPSIDLGNTHARLPLAPKFNLALLASYDFDLSDTVSGRFSVNERYVGNRTIGFNTPISTLYPLGSYNLTDLDVAFYLPHHLEFDIFAKNVFDAVGALSAVTLANEYNPAAPVPVTLTQPRTIGIGLTAKL